MGEKLKQSVQVPVWVITLAVTLFLSIIGFTVRASGRISRIEEKTLKNEQIIDLKANQSDVDRIYIMLDRIENKIDNLNNK